MILLLNALLLLSAKADSIYLSPAVNLESKTVTFSFLPNIQRPTKISQCQVVKNKVILEKFEINLELTPQITVKTFSKSFQLVGKYASWKDFDQTKVECLPKVKSTGWIFKDLEAWSDKPLKAWQVKEGVLYIGPGHFQVDENLDLTFREVRIATRTSLTIRPGKAVSLSGTLAPISFLTVKGNLILNSETPLLMSDFKGEMGSNTLYRHSQYNCSLCLRAPSVKIKKISISKSQAEYAIDVQTAELYVEHARIFENLNSGLHSSGSNVDIRQSTFYKNKKDQLVLSHSSGMVLQSTFESSEAVGVKVRNNSHVQISESLFRKLGFGVSAENSSEARTHHNKFSGLEVALGAYKKDSWWKGSIVTSKLNEFTENSLNTDADRFSKVSQ